MGAFCCHGNQTKRQTIKVLAFWNCPYQSNICTKLVILLQWFWRRGHLIESFLKSKVAMTTKQNGQW